MSRKENKQEVARHAPVSRAGLDEIAACLKKNRVQAALIEDSERSPDISLFYLTGIRESASVIILDDGSRILIPWDYELALRTADAEEIVQRPPSMTMPEFLEQLLTEKLGSNFTLEVSAHKSYLGVLALRKRLKAARVICRRQGISALIDRLRAVKSDAEIRALKGAAEITNRIVADMPGFLELNRDATEVDMALWIENAARKAGATGPSFETIVASPARSWQLHAIPGAGTGKFAGRGLALIDFGVKFNGYCSDVTVPFAFGRLNSAEQKMLDTVRKAYERVINTLEPGLPLWRIHDEGRREIEKAGYKLIHSIGHGLGLEAHDPPFIPVKKPEQGQKDIPVLRPGMVITVEPGIYDAEHGGVRLENDVLVTETGVELITCVEPVYC